MADIDQANIDETIAALEAGVTGIPIEQAIEVLDAWQLQLKGLAIADDLGKLKDALRKEKSADAIANLLTSLGGDTSSELTIAASEEVTEKIRQLSRLLTQAGAELRQ